MLIHARRFIATCGIIAVALALALPALAQQKSAPPPAKPAVAAPARPITPAPATAGAVGRISGRALERGKDPLGYANVVVLGTKQGTATDENGNFVIGNVPVGTYQIKLQAIGYDPVVLPEIGRAHV